MIMDTAVPSWASGAVGERIAPMSSVWGGKEDIQGCL